MLFQNRHLIREENVFGVFLANCAYFGRIIFDFGGEKSSKV